MTAAQTSPVVTARDLTRHYVLSGGAFGKDSVVRAVTGASVDLHPGRTLEEVQTILPDLVGHEEEHAWQWAVCLGLPFIPLYFAAAGWSLLRCGDRASATLFDRQAGLRRGGYPERPKRPLATLFTRAGGK